MRSAFEERGAERVAAAVVDDRRAVVRHRKACAVCARLDWHNNLREVLFWRQAARSETRSFICDDAGSGSVSPREAAHVLLSPERYHRRWRFAGADGREESCLRYPGGNEGQMSPGRAGPSRSLPARPGLAPPMRRPAPTRPWCVRVLDSTGLITAAPGIPGHALPEKGLQRQIGVGTLVSSQERRALFVPRFNRTFCSSTGLHRISFVRASEESFTRVLFGTLLDTRDRCPLGEPNRRRPFRPGPAWPRRRAVHRPAPTRPWYVRVLDSAGSRTCLA